MSRSALTSNSNALFSSSPVGPQGGGAGGGAGVSRRHEDAATPAGGGSATPTSTHESDWFGVAGNLESAIKQRHWHAKLSHYPSGVKSMLAHMDSAKQRMDQRLPVKWFEVCEEITKIADHSLTRKSRFRHRDTTQFYESVMTMQALQESFGSREEAGLQPLGLNEQHMKQLLLRLKVGPYCKTLVTQFALKSTITYLDSLEKPDGVWDKTLNTFAQRILPKEQYKVFEGMKHDDKISCLLSIRVKLVEQNDAAIMSNQWLTKNEMVQLLTVLKTSDVNWHMLDHMVKFEQKFSDSNDFAAFCFATDSPLIEASVVRECRALPSVLTRNRFNKSYLKFTERPEKPEEKELDELVLEELRQALSGSGLGNGMHVFPCSYRDDGRMIQLQLNLAQAHFVDLIYVPKGVNGEPTLLALDSIAGTFNDKKLQALCATFSKRHGKILHYHNPKIRTQLDGFSCGYWTMAHKLIFAAFGYEGGIAFLKDLSTDKRGAKRFADNMQMLVKCLSNVYQNFSSLERGGKGIYSAEVQKEVKAVAAEAFDAFMLEHAPQQDADEPSRSPSP